MKSPNNCCNSALWADVSSVTWTWDFLSIIVTALLLEEPSVKTNCPFQRLNRKFLWKNYWMCFQKKKKSKKGLEDKWKKIWPQKSIRATCQSSLFCKRNCSWSLLNGITIFATSFPKSSTLFFFFYLLYINCATKLG